MPDSTHTFHEFREAQQRILRDTMQVYRSYGEALKESRAHRGGMHWKRVRGREYLYRYRDRLGHGHSLGPRSPHTEELIAAYARSKRHAAEALRDVRRRINEQARFCRAAFLARVPRWVTQILRRLEHHELWGENVLVVGAHAIFAYELAAGVLLRDPRSPAKAPDYLVDGREPLLLATDLEVDGPALLGVLRAADRSFAPAPDGGPWAVNKNGHRVALLYPPPEPPRLFQDRGGRGPTPASALWGGGLHSLLASPKFSQVVIGADGYPATMVVPDPRAYALHRLSLSEQEDRDAGTRDRDRRQALAVAELTWRYLPQYDFFPADLRRFPGDLAGRAEMAAEEW